MTRDNQVKTWGILLPRLERLIDRVEELLANAMNGRIHQENGLFEQAIAFRWVGAHLDPIRHPEHIDLDDLIGLDRQIAFLVQNTQQFLAGLPANNVLLWGERGTGKSSTVKGLLTRFAKDGLRVVEMRRDGLLNLPRVVDLLWDRPERFILFCDDLSFEENDHSYKELKAMLEGGLTARPENVLIYATSNRRHLIPERFSDQTPRIDESGEIRPEETVEEKTSLSDRFGIRLGFYRIDQETYLSIVRHLVIQRGLSISPDDLRRKALEWAAASSGRSGRVARQFVDDLTGKLGLQNGYDH
ncbi:MAG: ATP-binding protein [Candidatus Latescibacteria bacterium]|nr:ATP-binding protein [Candidatus Latescibacterota bacterium]